MKARMYIVTYNSEHHINEGLETLFASDLSQHELEIFIINNHSNFHLHDEFVGKVTVLHNVLRLDSSTGHTTRNWNQALMLGFEDLNNPQCDIVICAQDDVLYQPQWLNLTYKAHFEMGYDFVCTGIGDVLHSYTPTAIKKVGMWDERFCVVCLMEHDYFIRAAMHLNDKASVTDTGHSVGLYTFNPLPFVNQMLIQPVKEAEKHALTSIRRTMDTPPKELFKAKWGMYTEQAFIDQFVGKPRKPNIPSYVTYPYFERNIDDLEGLGFNLAINK